MKNPLTAAARAAGGAARAFGATARAMALDATSATARLGEAAGAQWGADEAGPGTVRIRVLILRDENGTPVTAPEAVTPALERADRILRAGAGLRLRVTEIRIADRPASPRELDPRANRRLLLDHILGHTAAYHGGSMRQSPWSIVGDVITVVVVRTIAGRTTGCSLGMTTDWVICQANLFDPANPRTYDETVLAHELGHAMNLPHVKDISNLMHPTSSPPRNVRGTELRRWQAWILQANRHVVPPHRRGRQSGR